VQGVFKLYLTEVRPKYVFCLYLSQGLLRFSFFLSWCSNAALGIPNFVLLTLLPCVWFAVSYWRWV